MKIELGKQYVTKCGLVVEVFATTVHGDYVYVFRILTEDKISDHLGPTRIGTTYYWTKEGKFDLRYTTDMDVAEEYKKEYKRTK